MGNKNLCAEFKTALEKDFGWSILSMEKDEYAFMFKVAVPDNDFFWKGAEEGDEEGTDTIVPGLSINGFGRGCVMCSMPMHFAVSHFNLRAKLPLEERIRGFVGDRYRDILELISIIPNDESDQEHQSALASVRILPGQSFRNEFALNVASVDGDILVLIIEDYDLDFIPDIE